MKIRPTPLYALLARLILLLCCTGMSACGFQLRGAVSLPPGLKSVFIEGAAPNTIFYQQFRDLLTYAGVTLTADRNKADTVVQVTRVVWDRREVALDKDGKAIEYQIRYLVAFQVNNRDGSVVMPNQTVTVVRDYFNEQIEVIGKSEEETIIRQEMERFAASQVLERMEASLMRGAKG